VHRFVHEVTTAHTPESLAEQLRGEPGLAVLRSALFEVPQARYSFVTARPFLTFRSFGSRCEIATAVRTDIQFGNPWQLLDSLMARCELLDEIDLPFPLGGCFGYWGYDLKNFSEPKLPRRAHNDLELPDCHVGFHDSLVVFDHHLAKTWIVSTGLTPDGSRNETRAREQMEFWRTALSAPIHEPATNSDHASRITHHASPITSTLTHPQFLSLVHRALEYIRTGHIYQVNLAQRLSAPCPFSGWELFERLLDVSPAPFAAYFDCSEFQVASSSPELFLHLTGSKIQTRPIKGTRPRAADPTRDAQLAYELQTSPKELAELVMITDLLRNDLGRVCEYGTVQVPDLARLERYPQVQHPRFHSGGPVATGNHAFWGVGRLFSRWQHHRRAQVPRHGDHRRTGTGHPRPIHWLPRLPGLQPRKPAQRQHPHRRLPAGHGLFSCRRRHRRRFRSRSRIC